MPAYLSPLLNDQACDANGAPLSGGRVYSYAAGTSTPIATYTDADGLTPQSNPIILNTAGRPDSPIWLPAGQAVKLVLKTSADVLVDDWDDVTGINDPSLSNAVDQWVTFSGTPTYISATSFSVVGDQTNVLQVLRKLRTTNTGGTVYSRISASSYSPGTGLTTVTVVNESGTLDAGLSAVSYGLLSATNPSVPETSAARALRETAAGVVIDRAYAEYATNADIATVIPFDNTIPQIGEGTEILAASITPKSATSRLRVRVQGWGSMTGLNASFAFAAFVNGGANAIGAAASGNNSAAGTSMPCVLEFEYAPASTSAQAISIRVGPSNGTLRLNGTTSARWFGGVSRTTLVVEEFAA